MDLWNDSLTCKNYIINREKMFNNEKKMLDHLIRYIDGGDVLDLCCGSGIHAQYLASKCRKVVAVDNSEIMINKAMKKRKSNLSFILEDVNNFYINEKFNLISFFYGSFIFTNIEKAKKILVNIKNFLKDDGILIIDNRDFYFMYNLIGTNSWIEKEGHFELQEYSIDSFTEVITTKTHYVFKNNQVNYSVNLDARYYTLREFQNMFYDIGLSIKHIYGDYDMTEYSINNSPRIIIVCSKMK